MYKIEKPFNTFHLQVDDENKVFVKQYGNKKGIPIFSIHGGPGGFSSNKKTKKFNLKKFHLITIDQRGCGKSTPHLVVKNNNTDNLIEDIEKIRKHLNMKKFIITGGSWGASLSLLYCIKYPKNIITYIVGSGSFFTTNSIWPKSVISMFPDKWEKFCSLINISKKDLYNPSFALEKKICSTYFNKIKNNDMKYIKSWFNFEHDLVYTKKQNKKTKLNQQSIDLAFYESYYYSKNFFRPINYIENNCSKIKDIKGYILHGRIDIICDYSESYIIHKKLPKSTLITTDDEGHWGSKSDKKLLNLLDDLANKLYNNRLKYYFNK
mgnify:CR=1 FL=1